MPTFEVEAIFNVAFRNCVWQQIIEKYAVSIEVTF